MKEYKICKRCIMDTTDPEISFDEYGICSHCHHYAEREAKELLSPEERKDALNRIVDQIRKEGAGKKYDCIIGVSGGVDSTYVAYIVKKLGLRPLAVHVDNGWNSELAVMNIQNTLNKLGIDLYTNVLDWDEFKDLQKSFLKASTPDSEVPTDHAITATIYKVAAKEKVRYLILGSNIKTEAIMPRAWSQGHSDWKYIRGLQKRFGTKKLKTFPHYSMLGFLYYRYILKLVPVYILDYIDYNKQEAMETIKRDLEWREYGGKHHESIYTRFFQSYILPHKFSIDKRKGHLSTLINSGQITREQALDEMEKEICDKQLVMEDYEYVAKKLGFTMEEFDQLMNEKPKRFQDYPSYENSWYYSYIRAIYKALKRIVNT